MIMPIQTAYNGYRFRSRLEARWAVFFGALDVRYDYEHEGFAYGDGNYLPDFSLPELRCFVEVKPRMIALDDPGYVRALAVQSLIGVRVVSLYIICGNPWPGEYTIIRPAPAGEYTHCRFAVQPITGALCYVANDGTGWGIMGCAGNDTPPKDDDDDLICAYASARGARFEHNEEPTHV